MSWLLLMLSMSSSLIYWRAIGGRRRRQSGSRWTCPIGRPFVKIVNALFRSPLRGKDWAIRWQQQTAIEADCCTDLGFPETDCPNTSSKTKRNRWMTTESVWNSYPHPGIWVGGTRQQTFGFGGRTCPSPSIDLRLVGDSASLLSSYDCCW